MRQHIAEVLKDQQGNRIGLAVSGGGDSMALLALASEWAGKNKTRIFAATVNHHLRASAEEEARMVEIRCRKLGIPHTTLNWKPAETSGNLQDRARNARFELLTDWAKANDISAIATGHTKDDQAETILMRLFRGSGVDGLCGIPERNAIDGMVWLRPLLLISREELRSFLKARQWTWAEDPSNDDTQFERVRMRALLAELDPNGTISNRLTQTASHMKRAKEALEHSLLMSANGVAVSTRIGSLIIDQEAFRALHPEFQLRFLSRAISRISSTFYRPRLEGLCRFRDAMIRGEAASLAGCLLSPSKQGISELVREPAAMAKTPLPCELYDGRWIYTGAGLPDGVIRPLGEDGAAQCPDWKEGGFSRMAVLSSPSVWVKNELVLAPFCLPDKTDQFVLRDQTDPLFDH